MFFRQKKSGSRVYLQVVENRWQGGRSKQRVIATLGRLDQLQQSGQLEGLLRSGAKFCQSVLLLAAHRRGETTAICTRPIGPAMIFERRWQYILGARMRSQKEVRQEVLSRGGRFREVHPARAKRKDPSPLKVKEVFVERRRYVVCLNQEEARKDAHDRETIVASLREQLKQGDKSLVGNRGFRKYLKGAKSKFEMDEKKIKQEARYDGKWVLRTNTDLSASDVALKYKQLWMVEHVFRSAKSLLETRPIWHKCDETIRGHVFCSFLALVLRKQLNDCLAEQGDKLERDDILRDLGSLPCAEVQQDGKRFLLRSEAQGTCGKVFAAAGVALPPTVQQIEAP